MVCESKVPSNTKVAHLTTVQLISILIEQWRYRIVKHVSALHVAEFVAITLIGRHCM